MLKIKNAVKSFAVLCCMAIMPMSVSAEEICNTKINYGQGHNLDDMKRPYDSIEAQEKYGKYSADFIKPAYDKTIYLTFDEGYENGYTEKILDILKEKSVTASFYVTLDYVKENEALIRRMIDEGHNVGNHTCSHPSLADISDMETAKELYGLERYMRDNFGYKMTTVRPPRGEFSERSLFITSKLGYRSVMWSFAYQDWDVNNQPEPAFAYGRITKATHPGEICLLHAVSKTNTVVLPKVLDFWSENGYKVTAI